LSQGGTHRELWYKGPIDNAEDANGLQSIIWSSEEKKNSARMFSGGKHFSERRSPVTSFNSGGEGEEVVEVAAVVLTFSKRVDEEGTR